jgi:hypothetical protein
VVRGCPRLAGLFDTQSKEALPDALVRAERVLPEFDHKHTIMCCWFGYRYHTLSPHTYIYIAALLHSYSINSVLHSSITTIREIMLPRTASNKAVNLRLVKHANLVLEYRLVCELNKVLKTLSKDDKGEAI